MVFPRQAYRKVLVVTQILMKPPLSGRRKGQSMEKLSNPQVTIETIKKYEFAFQKKFGQNFLIDSHVINKIISAADITKDDCVLEIGPGIGTMTQYLAESAGQVVAVEIDKNPYYITTPIIMGLFEKHVPLLSVTVMVQKEVADRMQVGPGTKDYGALSLAVQYYAEPYIVANVPPNCFIPRPGVGSAVIRLTRFQEPPVKVKDEQLMFRLIRASFNQRRKTLQNGIANSGELSFTKEEVAKALESLGISANIRGESLGLAEFAALSDILSDK